MKKSKFILCAIFAVIFASCGSTTVSVQKPQQGTMTTITVTTNNPITTDFKPNTEVSL